MNWETVFSDTQMQVGGHYFCLGNDLVHLSLPENPSTGDLVAVYSSNNQLLSITQRDGEKIRLGLWLSTPGTSGGLFTANEGDTATLVYCADTGYWEGVSFQGNTYLI